jgi:hypothetical protein
MEHFLSGMIAPRGTGRPLSFFDAKVRFRCRCQCNIKAFGSQTPRTGQAPGTKKPLETLCFKRLFGTPSGTRTLDTLIKSQVLYQLS